MAVRVVAGLCVRCCDCDCGWVDRVGGDGEVDEGASGGGMETMCAVPEGVRWVRRGLAGSLAV